LFNKVEEFLEDLKKKHGQTGNSSSQPLIPGRNVLTAKVRKTSK